MILIDQPFVSDFLIKTIQKNNFEVVATQQAKDLLKGNTINWVSENIAKSSIEKNPNTLFYTNSENAISWVYSNLQNTNLPKQIEQFKDKVKFRELLKDTFPNFLFKTVKLEGIQNLKIEELPFPFVIKPAVGFFSIGVHIVHDVSDWNSAKKELNYKNLQSIYPENVMSASSFIIEEYIEGEEYAIDCYFDQEGKPVILNILHHKFSSGSDVSDRMYSTSYSVIKKYKDSVTDFLKPIGKKAELKNFPMHIEIRIDSSGKITPIEVNPLRFGGWCTTGDLTWYAYGINSYEYFLNRKTPNWEELFKNKEEKIYSIIILNNNSGIAASDIVSFNYKMLQNDLENVLELRKLDINKNPVFGFIFSETSLDNTAELERMLSSNLTKYINL